jgi:hypothetical protein
MTLAGFDMLLGRAVEPALGSSSSSASRETNESQANTSGWGKGSGHAPELSDIPRSNELRCTTQSCSALWRCTCPQEAFSSLVICTRTDSSNECARSGMMQAPCSELAMTAAMKMRVPNPRRTLQKLLTVYAPGTCNLAKDKYRVFCLCRDVF